MDDLISRQAAIDALQKCRKHCIDPFDSYHIDIQPEPHWIPVSERVPEDYADVLVWFEYFRYGNYSSEFDSWMINHESGWHKLRVFAWMPLPEPYRKGDK